MSPVHIDEVVVDQAPPPAATGAAPAPAAPSREIEDRAERHLRRVSELQERLRAD